MRDAINLKDPCKTTAWKLGKSLFLKELENTYEDAKATWKPIKDALRKAKKEAESAPKQQVVEVVVENIPKMNYDTRNARRRSRQKKKKMESLKRENEREVLSGNVSELLNDPEKVGKLALTAFNNPLTKGAMNVHKQQQAKFERSLNAQTAAKNGRLGPMNKLREAAITRSEKSRKAKVHKQQRAKVKQQRAKVNDFLRARREAGKDRPGLMNKLIEANTVRSSTQRLAAAKKLASNVEEEDMPFVEQYESLDEKAHDP